MKPAEFLKNYHTVIFDMDGVITSEQNYWDIAALSVYELLNDKLCYGGGTVEPCVAEKRADIRGKVFFGDRFITAVKEKGVNSNWDLCYLAFCYLLGGRFTPRSMTAHVRESPLGAFGLYDEAGKFAAETLGISFDEAKRNAPLWERCRRIFQEWYLGDRLFEEMYGERSSEKGKPGMWSAENPLHSLEDTVRLLKTLCESGKTLAIATGRSCFEITAPLKQWDCLKYFDENRIIGYDYVVSGEKNLRAAGIDAALTKPCPYVFLKALYGRDYSDISLYNGDYDKNFLKGALAVGDAGSDILAAKAMGADFIAVLTGVSGEKARDYFEEAGARYILPSVLHLIES